jgi:hypothetical protein
VTPPRLPHPVHLVHSRSMSLDAFSPQMMMAGASANGALCRHVQRGQWSHTQH